MAKHRLRPPTEIVWALEHADRRTIRRARRLAHKGVAADDVETARIVMALAHAAETRRPGPIASFVIGLSGLFGLALGLASDGAVTGAVPRALVGFSGAYVLVMIPRALYRSHVTAPRAEAANRAFLKQAGHPYRPLDDAASVRLAPLHLLLIALAWVVPNDLLMGVILGGTVRPPTSSLTALVALGGPYAIEGSLLSAAMNRRAWKPRRPADRRHRGWRAGT